MTYTTFIIKGHETACTDFWTWAIDKVDIFTDCKLYWDKKNILSWWNLLGRCLKQSYHAAALVIKYVVGKNLMRKSETHSTKPKLSSQKYSNLFFPCTHLRYRHIWYFLLILLYWRIHAWPKKLEKKARNWESSKSTSKSDYLTVIK